MLKKKHGKKLKKPHWFEDIYNQMWENQAMARIAFKSLCSGLFKILSSSFLFF